MKSNKICPYLLNQVRVLQQNDNGCIVYCNNLEVLHDYLDREKIKNVCYPFIKAFYIKSNYEQIKRLSMLASVNYITADTKVFAMVNDAKTFMQIENLQQNKYYGKGITIAFIDTGIAPHLDFLLPHNRILKFVDILNDKTCAYDDNGHGTFVAGVACSSGVCNRKKYSGIAPLANRISIKALDKNGETTANNILDAMQYIYDNKEKLNIKVVCMSFGAESSGIEDPLQRGAETLWNSGIVVVAAAGNSGPGEKTIKSPGSNSRIITVGGLADGRNETEIAVAEFSSRGPTYSRFKPDLIAPGVNIVSTTPYSLKKEHYTTMSGTSVSAPMVAGICAVVLEKYPHFSPDRVKYFLTQNCTSILKDRNSEGFGYIKFCAKSEKFKTE